MRKSRACVCVCARASGSLAAPVQKESLYLYILSNIFYRRREGRGKRSRRREKALANKKLRSVFTLFFNFSYFLILLCDKWHKCTSTIHSHTLRVQCHSLKLYCNTGVAKKRKRNSVRGRPVRPHRRWCRVRCTVHNEKIHLFFSINQIVLSPPCRHWVRMSYTQTYLCAGASR